MGQGTREQNVLPALGHLPCGCLSMGRDQRWPWASCNAKASPIAPMTQLLTQKISANYQQQCQSKSWLGDFTCAGESSNTSRAAVTFDEFTTVQEQKALTGSWSGAQQLRAHTGLAGDLNWVLLGVANKHFNSSSRGTDALLDSAGA